MSKILYYDSFDTDFATSRGQDYRLPADYRWEQPGFARKIAGVLLHGVAWLIDAIYRRFVARVRIKNRRLLRKEKRGYFLFSNHTQVFGDVVNPYALCWPKRPRILCSPANLGIPAIGRWLPLAGALPIPDKLAQLKVFSDVVVQHIADNHAVVVYPEGHVWPYYTDVRPFEAGAFHYAAKVAAPVYVATTTYRKTRWLKRPKQIIYLDGPLIAPDGLRRKALQAWYERAVRQLMQRRAKTSDCEYVTYRRKS